MASMLADPISVTLQIKKDSIRYYNGKEYTHERIIHQNGKTFLTNTAYIHVQTNYRAMIGILGKNKPVKYKIKRVTNTCY